MDIVIGILSIMGLGFIFWLIGLVIKSGVSNMLPNNVKSDLEEVSLYNERSRSGISKVIVAYRSKRTGICTANVVCRCLGKDEWTAANDMRKLHEQVSEIYERNDNELKQQRKR